MRVRDLALQDFRNYEHAQLRFAEGVNLVVGSNAQGKTNLLEAVYCLGGMGSPRAHDAALVREGAERGLIHATVERDRRLLRVDLEVRPGRGTRALLNKTPAPSRALAEVTTGVFFGPDELSLVKGSPEIRRRFLDELAVKLKPAREGARRELERVLRQRNALLRSAPRHGGSGTAASTLEVWDESLCRSGATVCALRLEVLARLLPFACARYLEVSGGGELALGYETSWIEEAYLLDCLHHGAPIDEPRLRAGLRAALEEVRPRELERGISLAGPQRDDISVRLRSPGADNAGLLDARTFASQGDQRTAALAMKLAESDVLAAASGERPILMLDDVFSELDGARRAWLAAAVQDIGQVIVSSAEPGADEEPVAELVVRVDRGSLRVDD